MGGLGKDFGSMNMDELLKNIGSAEETQGITSTTGAGEGNPSLGNLQRQGSLTLPRTLSLKIVDDVKKELIRESGDTKFGNVGVGSNLPQEQRQQSLGEMTLEEFLVRAGVVREDAQEMARPGNGGFFGESFRQSNNTGVAPGYQQVTRNNGLMGSRVESNNNSVPNQFPKLGLNVGGVRTWQQQTHQLPPQQQQHKALADPMIEELIQKPLFNIEETRIWMHDMMEEIDEEPHSYRMATSTAWTFLLTNVGLEISSAMFDQFFFPSNKPQAALISMVLAILAVIISIWELIHKGVKERVKYKRQLGMFGWFYSHSGNKIFGSVPDMCGLLGGISQCVYATIQYVCIVRHIENPYKIYLWPIIFLLCLGASRLQWNQRNMTRKLKL